MVEPQIKMAIKNILLIVLALIANLGPVMGQGHKALSVLGDSYSTFTDYMTPDTNLVWYGKEHLKHTDVRQVTETWWHQLARENGLRLCVNNSYSGATICNTGYRKEDYSDRSFCTRLNRLGCPDIIVVFGGTNDTWAHSPIGDFQYGNWQPADLYAFRPAMAYLLAHLQERYPNVDLYVVINDVLSAEITSSMEEICAHYGVRYILLKDIDKRNGHPTVKGMGQIAVQLKDIVK